MKGSNKQDNIVCVAFIVAFIGALVIKYIMG